MTCQHMSRAMQGKDKFTIKRILTYSHVFHEVVRDGVGDIAAIQLFNDVSMCSDEREGRRRVRTKAEEPQRQERHDYQVKP